MKKLQRRIKFLLNKIHSHASGLDACLDYEREEKKIQKWKNEVLEIFNSIYTK